MAEEALKRLEEQLNCSICLDTFTDPKLLQCFHVFCQQCLVPLGVRDQQGQLSLTCPTCRQVTPIPANGVTGLHSAFHINHLLEIQDSVQKLQNPQSPLEGAIVEIASKRTAQCCSSHSEEKLKLYCETCGKLICCKCALKGGKHWNHDYGELNEAFEKYKEEVASAIEPMEKQVVIIKKALTLIEKRCGEISDQREVIESSIHVTFRRLREVLTVRETDLIRQLHQMTQEKLKGLAAQSDQIETQLNSCLHYIREGIKVVKESDVLMMKANTLCQVKELTTPFRVDTLKPNTEADMIFSAIPSLTTDCEKYGQILTIDTSKCHITDKHLESGVKSMAILQGMELNKSTLECHEPPILTIDGVKGPRGVAINQRGEVVVTEGDIHHVSVFSPKGEKLRSFGTRGSDLGQLRDPRGVAVDGEGNILVADNSNHRIQKFTEEGQFLSAVKHSCPTDLAFNTSNSKVYVLDRQNNQIQVLNSDLTFSSTLGNQGSDKGKFNNPWGIACDSTGKVYVANLGNHRIQVFTAEGEFVRMFGRRGEGNGELSDPYYVAVDSSGMVYVSEHQNHRVSVFSEGQYVMSFGRKGVRQGEFQGPYGLAVDNNGLVYVCDCTNNRVQVF